MEGVLKGMGVHLYSLPLLRVLAGHWLADGEQLITYVCVIYIHIQTYIYCPNYYPFPLSL